jgi:cation transport ATPase
MTVVSMCVSGVPQIILTLEEMHIAKPESREVVDYLRNTLKMRVAMITGDNKQAYPIDKRRAVERMQAQ